MSKQGCQNLVKLPDRWASATRVSVSRSWNCSCIIETRLVGPNNYRMLPLQDADLTGAKLINAEIEEVDLSATKSLHNVYFCGARFAKAYMLSLQIKNGTGEERDKDYYRAKEAYLALKNNFLSLGRYDDASWAYFKERQMERKANNPLRARRFYSEAEAPNTSNSVCKSFAYLLVFYAKHTLRWILDWMAELTCGYGEKPLRTVTFAVLIIFFFPFLYHLSGGLTSITNRGLHWIDYLQFSLSSFTTMTHPDVIPTNHATKILTNVEALIGISVLALLMFSLGKRISRS